MTGVGMNYIKEIGFRKSRMRFVLSILVGIFSLLSKGKEPALTAASFISPT